MTKKIFQSTITVVITMLLLSFLLITGVLYQHFEQMQLNQMQSMATFVMQGAEEDGMDYFKDLKKTEVRVTWIAADGTVLYDNCYDATKMENHRNRQEVQEALTAESGISIRRSSTLSEHTIYYAKKMPDGSVMRLATAQSSVWFLIGGLLSPVLFIFLAACALAGVLSYRVSKKIVRPLSEIDLKHPEQVDTYEELSPFLQRIAMQNQEIDAQMAEIRKQQQEFSMITENMSEGLLVVDRNYQLLSYNKSAVRIFGISNPAAVKNVLAVNRSQEFREAVENAWKGRHTQQRLQMGERIYQVIANAVSDPEDTEDLLGAVILVLDVTEREEQEKYRREFTANVSH